MNVEKVEPLTFNKILKILRATHLSPAQKELFIHENNVVIDELFASKVNTTAFDKIMKSRPLKLFKPLKNSFTKAGDKKILAQTLGIEPSEVNAYVQNIVDCIENNDVTGIPRDRLEIAKMYTYRHGTKDQVIEFLDYELSSTNDVLGVLYRTLSYNTGGAADYFVRPIHRMDNKTLVRLYDIVDKNLKDAANSGNITEIDRERTAEWALVRIYEIQNNQKLKNAVKLKNELETN